MKTKFVYDPKVSRKKMLADLDYLESRTTEKNTNSMLSFENPYEACKEAHIAVLTEWDEFVQYDWQRIYDSMQKPAFV
jgi:UDPglucose 6-dehydrogenase